MRPINYRHLLYFWTVAKAGGVTRAAERLHLTPQSISGQLRAFEGALGQRLLQRRGRGLELTDAGRTVLTYADEIFALGSELQDAVRHGPRDRPKALRIGVADIVSKAVAHLLLQPALAIPEPVRLVCREWRLTDLLAELAVHRLELVIADRPMPPEVGVKAYNHFLGECGVAFFAAPSLARGLRGSFPRALDGAPMLLPGEDAAVHQRLRQWFGAVRVRPRIVGEFDDAALLSAFGQAGAGVFTAPAVIAAQVARERGALLLGRSESVVEQFYAISMERRLTHPAVVAVGRAARSGLFRGGRLPRSPKSGRPLA